MRTVVHVVNAMRPGGIETLVLDLMRRGDRGVRVISLEGDAATLVRDWPVLEPFAGRIDALGRRAGLSPLLVVRLAARLRELKPDCVLVHHVASLIYGGTAARLAGVKSLVFVEHAAWHYSEPRTVPIIRWLSRVLRPRYVAVSGQVANVLRSVVPGALVTVIPPGVDMERYRPAEQASARARIGMDPGWTLIGTVGRVEDVKGHAVLIEALARLDGSVHVVIVGDGSRREAMKQLALRLDVQDRVHFLGHRDDLEQILPAFDVFCLPSLSEGLPRVVLEAQAADIPVIASRVGALADAVCPDTGALVVANDVAALAGALTTFLAVPKQVGVSRAFVENRYSLARTATAYDQMVAS